jgi:hypothetical protein
MKNAIAHFLVLIAALSGASLAAAGPEESPGVSPESVRWISWNPANSALEPLGNRSGYPGHRHPVPRFAKGQFPERMPDSLDWTAPVSILGQPLALDLTKGRLSGEHPDHKRMAVALDDTRKPWNRQGPAAPRVQFRVAW